ncbi:MAG: hypothetical protein CL483_09405 [Acidobacteria bacterium]|nr:hypothetical protein [Acidobacteriota bacterium]|tara:strand:+ start:4198 stop:4644 length:447 start_codon:yes stop_codon:yes gene_type:complete
MVRSGLTLRPVAASAIRHHGRETYPHECCGALIGLGGLVTAALALPNTTDDGPRRRFLVRPNDYQAAERHAAELDAGLLGFYHSHPDAPARPSRYDLEHAWPVFSYVIIGVDGGDPGQMTSWRLRNDRSAFDQEQLIEADPDDEDAGV